MFFFTHSFLITDIVLRNEKWEKKGDFETFPEIRGEILGNAFFFFNLYAGNFILDDWTFIKNHKFLEILAH